MEEQKEEEKKDIVVLDHGFNLSAVENGPEIVCCWGAFGPIRG